MMEDPGYEYGERALRHLDHAQNNARESTGTEVEVVYHGAAAITNAILQLSRTMEEMLILMKARE